jgi:colanic acid/amylovoran biosynthesis glycosyltransferase
VSAQVKVCYVINQYPKVSHSFIRREILALERLGVEVFRVAMRGGSDKVVDAGDIAERSKTRYVLAQGALVIGLSVLRVALGSPVRFLRAVGSTFRLGRGSGRPYWIHFAYLAEASVVALWVRQERCQHIHAHFGTNPADVALLTSELAGVPFSFTVHGPEEFDRPQAIALPMKIRRAAAIIAISSFGRSQLFRWAVPADWQKIHVVHCGLDNQFIDMAESDKGPGSNRFLCIGRLCEQKGQLLLLRALRQVIDLGFSCQIVLAGDGEMRGLLETQAKALGVLSHLHITGWIDGEQVRDELLLARAMVLPSFAEGLPVVIMEAMALQRPVISTYVSGIPELVQPAVNGWLVPAGDVDLLAKALIACLDAPEAELQRMGSSGRTRVLERHDIRQSAGQLLRIFGDVK